jgi:hypothetical protein
VDFKELRNSERVVCWRGREVDEQWAKSFHFIFFAHSSAEIFSLFYSQLQNASAVPHGDEDFWNSCFQQLFDMEDGQLKYEKLMEHNNNFVYAVKT